MSEVLLLLVAVPLQVAVALVLWRKVLVPWTTQGLRGELGATPGEPVMVAVLRQLEQQTAGQRDRLLAHVSDLVDSNAKALSATLGQQLRDEAAALREELPQLPEPEELADRILTRVTQRITEDVQSEGSTVVQLVQHVGARVRPNEAMAELGRASGEARRSYKLEREMFAEQLDAQNPQLGAMFRMAPPELQRVVMRNPNMLAQLLQQQQQGQQQQPGTYKGPYG